MRCFGHVLEFFMRCFGVFYEVIWRCVWDALEILWGFYGDGRLIFHSFSLVGLKDEVVSVGMDGEAVGKGFVERALP